MSSASLPVGWTVCKYGITGGYRCGEIADKNSQSNYNGVVGTYIRVRNASNLAMSIAGDSGGPVFGSNTAYGLIHGRGATGTAFVNDMFFMPIERFSGLGISVVTTP
ncbi:S1 family peptidase [Luteimonas fraxinea]|uniref:S1 family peptidase n=1 Tax=Luteimonas fraxinea TaxID=2901869 RepID=A0ABS8UH79_9GAMM|nr:S1 family peptidase [Luteimonas fraxinea]MCD9098059.1 S1 family peptidase [Luteimonas fraxinea]UHH09216.1 S1 family peptidase [Luteimonas fraxinea]